MASILQKHGSDIVVLTAEDVILGGQERGVRIQFAQPFGRILVMAVDGQVKIYHNTCDCSYLWGPKTVSNKHAVVMDGYVTFTLYWKLSMWGFKTLKGAFQQWYVALVSDGGIVATYGDLNVKGLKEEWGIQHLPEGPCSLSSLCLEEGKVEWVYYDQEPVVIDNRQGQTDLQVLEKRARTVLVQASLEKSDVSDASLSSQVKLGDAKLTGGEWTLGGAVKQTLSEKMSEAKQNSKTCETAFTLICPKGKKYGWTIIYEQKVHRGVYTLLRGGVKSSLECLVPFDIRARVQADGDIIP